MNRIDRVECHWCTDHIHVVGLVLQRILSASSGSNSEKEFQKTRLIGAWVIVGNSISGVQVMTRAGDFILKAPSQICHSRPLSSCHSHYKEATSSVFVHMWWLGLLRV